jgi:hypothetical protein
MYIYTYMYKRICVFIIFVLIYILGESLKKFFILPYCIYRYIYIYIYIYTYMYKCICVFIIFVLLGESLKKYFILPDYQKIMRGFVKKDEEEAQADEQVNYWVDLYVHMSIYKCICICIYMYIYV